MKIARIVSRNVKPAFKHDCAECKFLGTLDGADLYVCDKAARFDGTIEYLARHGNAPAENGSLGNIAPEGSAYSLARALVARKVRTPNAYRTQDTETEMCGFACGTCSKCQLATVRRSQKSAECKGCEHCDGEGGHSVADSERAYEETARRYGPAPYMRESDGFGN